MACIGTPLCLLLPLQGGIYIYIYSNHSALRNW